MLYVTREQKSGRVVLTAVGALDDFALRGIVEAISLVNGEAPLIIDLTAATTMSESGLALLARAVAVRPGPVSFRTGGPPGVKPSAAVPTLAPLRP